MTIPIAAPLYMLWLLYRGLWRYCPPRQLRPLSDSLKQLEGRTAKPYSSETFSCISYSPIFTVIAPIEFSRLQIKTLQPNQPAGERRARISYAKYTAHPRPN
ncbi:hypothetical protein D3C76_1262460 [compost metagenome]